MSLQAAEPLARPAGTLRDAGGWPSAARRTGHRPGGGAEAPRWAGATVGASLTRWLMTVGVAEPQTAEAGGTAGAQEPAGKGLALEGAAGSASARAPGPGNTETANGTCPPGDTRAVPRARSDGGQHAEGCGAGRSGRSETSQSLPGFRIGAGVQPGDALTAGAAGGLAGRARQHHVATLPPAVLPRHLMLMLMASRCCGGRRAAPSYVRAAAGASAEGTGLPQGHIPFPGQPPSDDSLKEKYQSPPT